VNAGEMSVGEQASVVRVTGDDAISCRLMEMGIVPATELELIGMAPWGDPLEFAIRGYRLSLRRAEAARIEIVAK